MAALTAHYVTHARFLWKWLRNPDNRRNKLPFRQKRWAFQPVPLPLRQIQNRFVYGNSIYREKDLRGNDGTNGCLRGKGSRLTAHGKRLGKWLTGEEVCGQLRISLRTLQKLRDRGFIGYSQIGFRFYYKPEDVKRLIPLIGTICPTDK